MATYRFTARIAISGEIEVSDQVMNTANEPSPEALQTDLENLGFTVDFDGRSTWEIDRQPVRASLDGAVELEDVDVAEANH